jgi:hypothetical protein
MQKLLLLLTALVMVFLPAGMAHAEPYPDPLPLTPLAQEEETDSPDSDQSESLRKLLELLFGTSEADGTAPAPDGTTEETVEDETSCNPLSPWCLYDPFYGSCEWDMWLGAYMCDTYFYRTGYDCHYDWWYESYICREEVDSDYGGYDSGYGWW